MEQWIIDPTLKLQGFFIALGLVENITEGKRMVKIRWNSEPRGSSLVHCTIEDLVRVYPNTLSVSIKCSPYTAYFLLEKARRQDERLRKWESPFTPRTSRLFTLFGYIFAVSYVGLNTNWKRCNVAWAMK